MTGTKDIIEYNKQNTGTEGAAAGDFPAFASGQVSSSYSGVALSHLSRIISKKLRLQKVKEMRPIEMLYSISRPPAEKMV